MKKYLVMGLGKSGISAAKLLSKDNDVCCWDRNPESEFKPEIIEELKQMGVRFIFETEDFDEHFDICVISPGIKPANPVASHADKLIGELELAYLNCKGSFVGITGTNGKTTTTTLVGEFLKDAEIDSVVGGNIGVPVCEYSNYTNEETRLITEVSSYQLETTDTFRPHISAILNLTPDHLDRHGSAEEYYRCKCRIFENQTEEDFLVYNSDDEILSQMVKSAKAALVPFSVKKTAIEFAMENNCAYLNEGIITLKLGGKEKKILSADELLIPGMHNVENVLAAVLLGGLCGVSSRKMGKILKTFKGVEHRMETVREIKGVKYINDSKGTNPDSSIKAVEAVNTPIILIAGGYEKNTDFHGFINSFDGKVRYMILLGQTAARLAKEAEECGFDADNIIKCSSLTACVAAAAKLAEKGDTVLLSPACASWGMFENFEQRGKEFKKLVSEL